MNVILSLIQKRSALKCSDFVLESQSVDASCTQTERHFSGVVIKRTRDGEQMIDRDRAEAIDGCDGPVLRRADGPPFHRIAGSDRNWLLVCDHASNRVPASLGHLGLGSAELERHIAWDIGAAQIATRLAERLQAPLLMSAFSRLVIDCNRYPDAPDSVPRISDHCRIVDNEELSEVALTRRQHEILNPYHRAIDAALVAAEADGYTPAFLSIHTCTASMNGADRPWQIGIAWSRDQRMSAPVLDHLGRSPDVTVGDNQPYGLELGADFTTPEHAMTRGLAHLQVEFRQDLVSTPAGAGHWADILYEALMTTRHRDGWHRHEHHLTPADNIRGMKQWLHDDD